MNAVMPQQSSYIRNMMWWLSNSMATGQASFVSIRGFWWEEAFIEQPPIRLGHQAQLSLLRGKL
jgi:hypothetical protein